MKVHSPEAKNRVRLARRMSVGSATLLLTALFLPLVPTASAASGPFAWGADLDQWWSYDNAKRPAFIETADAVGMTTFFTDAKDGWGLANWYTPNYAKITSFGSGDGGVERVVRDAHARGMLVGARFDMFQDGEAGKRFPYAKIGSSTPAWVDPGCSEVRTYLLGMVKDFVSRTDVDEINIDHVRYPGADEISGGTTLPCTGGTLGSPKSDRTQIIADFIRDAAATARAAKPGIKVSASIFASTMSQPHPIIGQDAGKIAPHVDYVMSMAYPSYFGSTAASNPYKTVYDNTKLGVSKFGSAKIRPWVQGFDAYAKSASKVCDQLKAAADAGASGAFVWWFDTMGSDRAMWSSIAQCVPAGGGSAPAPTTGLSATFSPVMWSNDHVEAKVTANKGIAGVTASVNGGSAVKLTLWPNGNWMGGAQAPNGARVVFTATATDGSKATSATYTWNVGSSAPAPAPTTFSATFAPVMWSNDHVEAKVTAGKSISAVTASVNGGSAVKLSLWPNGNWMGAAQASNGARVVFTATASDGGTATSASYTWNVGGSTSPESPSMSATFTPVMWSNDHVEAKVTAGKSISGVSASVNGGAPVKLSLWPNGNWMGAARAPDGAKVVFTATASDGSKATSSTYTWNVGGSTPTTPGGFEADYSTKGGNEWWVAVKVTANEPISGVEARANGGSWKTLTLRSWGEWATSFHAPAGAKVEFRTKSSSGEYDYSGGYKWPTGTPV